MPGGDALQHIYSNILLQHLHQGGFTQQMMKFVPQLVHGSLTLHARITSTFLPTAIKFHYIFNLRDLSNIFQGILFNSPESVKTPVDLIRVWMHEACRVYKDKLVDDVDIATFDKVLKDTVKKQYEVTQLILQCSCFNFVLSCYLQQIEVDQLQRPFS